MFSLSLSLTFYFWIGYSFSTSYSLPSINTAHFSADITIQLRTIPSSTYPVIRLFDVWHFNSRLLVNVCRALLCHVLRDENPTILYFSFFLIVKLNVKDNSDTINGT